MSITTLEDAESLGFYDGYDESPVYNNPFGSGSEFYHAYEAGYYHGTSQYDQERYSDNFMLDDHEFSGE